MKRRFTTLIAGVLVALLRTAAPADTVGRVLWISDDVTHRIYRVTPDGVLLRSFPALPGVTSSVAIDPSNGTLWGAVEGTPPRFPGGIVNYTATGDLISSISETQYGGIGSEGAAVDPTAGTLWVVDDPEIRTPAVYNIRRDGTVVTSFPTSVFDVSALSPQDIAMDPLEGGLWVTDNRTNTIYNVTKDGRLVRALPRHLFDPTITNLQGIGVDRADGSLWVTARNPHRIYNITRAGDLVSSFPSSSYDPNSENPSGVAVDIDAIVDLGDADRFAVFGLWGSLLRMSNPLSAIDGDVGLGPRGRERLSSGLITGTYVVDPSARPRNIGTVIGGGLVHLGLAATVGTARLASQMAAALRPTQKLGPIGGTVTLSAAPGANVMAVRSIDLSRGGTLTIVGAPSAEVVLNVAGRLRLRHGSAIVLSGALTPGRVIVNVPGRGPRIEISGASRASGMVLAPHRDVVVRDPGSTISGSVIGGSRIAVVAGGRVVFQR